MDDAQSRGIRYLASVQNADGGWGYRPGGASYVEPTAAALLAHTLLDASAPHSAWEWLRKSQRADGAWGIDGSGSAPSWMTAWGVWAFTSVSSGADASARGANWLLNEPVLRIADADTTAAMRQLLDLDASRIGWPWQPGEAAWVLPTALSVLALASGGRVQEPRVADGVGYLLDRKCVAGGWNFGNPVMLGKPLPATLPETCLALLALRAASVAVVHPAVPAGLRFLELPPPQNAGSADAAWRLLGLRAWGGDSTGLRESIEAGQMAAGSWVDNPFSTAVALLALAPTDLVTRGRP